MHRSKRNVRRSFHWTARAFALLGALALDVATSACGDGAENALEGKAHAGGATSAPKVTVATPLSQSIREWREYTGRAEAIGSVEIRARVSGYLQRVAFKEGDLVKKGDLLFVVDGRPFQATQARAQAELEGARAEAALATLDAERNEKLWAGHAITDRERDVQRTQVAQRGAQAKRAEAVVHEAALDVEYANIKAPIDGRIGRTQVTPGNLVGPSLPTPLTTLVSVNPLHVYVDVVEADAMHLAESPRAAAVGFAGEEGYPHEAVLDFVDNHVDPATGTVKVRAVIPNVDGHLTPGLFARLRIGAQDAKETVLVTDSAFGTDQSHKFAYVIDAAGKAQYRDVELGGIHEGMRVVRSGLTAEDRVVVRGLQRVRPGAQVDAELAPMPTAGKPDAGAP
jgi:RND family efflux transporter MFP subunit